MTATGTRVEVCTERVHRKKFLWCVAILPDAPDAPGFHEALGVRPDRWFGDFEGFLDALRAAEVREVRLWVEGDWPAESFRDQIAEIVSMVHWLE